MSFKQVLRAISGAAVLATAGAASAAVITLDFEGIANLAAVGNYYNGGAGTNYGVSFSAATLAIIDSDAGGTGNIANEPSGSTVMFFLSGNEAILNVAAGFDTGFSFLYSSAFAASVVVYDGLNGTGNVLRTIDIASQHTQGCVGDPNGTFCNWSVAGSQFSGIARSISFGGAADFTVFDNITFGSAVPGGGGGVPEPTSVALVGAALLGVAASRRRKG